MQRDQGLLRGKDDDELLWGGAVKGLLRRGAVKAPPGLSDEGLQGEPRGVMSSSSGVARCDAEGLLWGRDDDGLLRCGVVKGSSGVAW